MGLLPVLQKMTNTWIISLVVAIIGLQTGLIECSGRVNLARPYLFRDFGMPSGGYAQLANLYQHKSTPQYSDSASAEDEEGGSSEEDAQYTPPLILDIDDPEVKARWLGLNSQSFEEYEEEEEEEGISSSEFHSRSSPELQSEPETDKAERKSDDNSESGEKRGILDSGFRIVSNPLLNFWKGSNPEMGSSSETQSDEVYPYYYNGFDYTPYETDEYPQSDLKKPKPKPRPMAKKPMKPPPPPPPMKMKTPKGPKPMRMKKKPMKPKPMEMKMKPMKPMKMKPMKAMSMKSKPMKPMPMMKGKPMKPKPQMEPEYSHQFHYQEIGKPDKLAMLKEKIAKFNPLRYIQIQKDTQPPPSMGMPPNKPPMKMPPPKMPPKMPPMKMPPPKMPSKMPPKPPKPPRRQKMRPKQKPRGKPKPPKPQQKPQHDEPGPEFVMYFGEPFTGFSPDFKNSQQQKQQPEQQDDEESDAAGSSYQQDDEESDAAGSSYQQDDEESETLYQEDSNESGYQQQEDDGSLTYQYQQEDETETDSPYLQTEEGGLAIQEQDGVAYQSEDEEGEGAQVEDDEEEDDEDDSEEDDEEEEEADSEVQAEGEGDYETPTLYQQEETEALGSGYDDVTIQPDGVAVQEGVIEDDEAELAALSPQSGTRTSMYSHSPKQKSYLDLHFGKYLRFGKGKKKRRPRPRYRPYPYKIPVQKHGWKQYKPKLSDAIGDSILNVVKNVGILPEYEKNEKYGGHNKIKGKFTKTRPITLHHGLLTEVLRRK